MKAYNLEYKEDIQSFQGIWNSLQTEGCESDCCQTSHQQYILEAKK